MGPGSSILEYAKNISKYIQDIRGYTKPKPRRRSRAGPWRRGRAGRGGPAAAWYFVYILYYILDIFGYVQFGHPSARRSATLIGHCHMFGRLQLKRWLFSFFFSTKLTYICMIVDRC